jgi:hypothetical protein
MTLHTLAGRRAMMAALLWLMELARSWHTWGNRAKGLQR